MAYCGIPSHDVTRCGIILYPTLCTPHSMFIALYHTQYPPCAILYALYHTLHPPCSMTLCYMICSILHSIPSMLYAILDVLYYTLYPPCSMLYHMFYTTLYTLHALCSPSVAKPRPDRPTKEGKLVLKILVNMCWWIGIHLCRVNS